MLAAALTGHLLPVYRLELKVLFARRAFKLLALVIRLLYERDRAAFRFYIFHRGFVLNVVKGRDLFIALLPASLRRLRAAHGQVQVRVAPSTVAMIPGGESA